MKQVCCSRLLWLGLLLAPFSQEQETSKPRKLCGKHLLEEIIKLCGQSDWSQLEKGEQIPLTHFDPKSSDKGQTFSPDQIPSTAWGSLTNSVPASVSQEKAIKTWEPQPMPDYQFEKAGLLHKKQKFLRRKLPSHNVSPYVSSVDFQRKSTNQVNTYSSLLWEHHPQRKRRGFADKCCIKGCTKEELAVACLPYVDA